MYTLRYENIFFLIPHFFSIYECIIFMSLMSGGTFFKQLFLLSALLSVCVKQSCIALRTHPPPWEFQASNEAEMGSFNSLVQWHFTRKYY